MKTTSALKLPLYEQPYDRELLNRSSIYKKSRQLYLKQGGRYHPTLLTAARSLGSLTLIENEITYSPLASELEWSLNDRIQRKDVKHFDLLKNTVTNVFHEQNHRTLWTHFKKEKLFCPPTRDEAYRFLNFVESLVICIDMALGDQLDERGARSLYELRIIYSPGSPFMRKLKVGSKSYREALQVILQTTFLRLEGMHIEDIPPAVKSSFASLDKTLVETALKRALLIEPLFVELTNPIWQKKHISKVIDAFKAPTAPRTQQLKGLYLPKREPLVIYPGYLIAEKWFRLFGL